MIRYFIVAASLETFVSTSVMLVTEDVGAIGRSRTSVRRRATNYSGSPRIKVHRHRRHETEQERRHQEKSDAEPIHVWPAGQCEDRDHGQHRRRHPGPLLAASEATYEHQASCRHREK